MQPILKVSRLKCPEVSTPTHVTMQRAGKDPAGQKDSKAYCFQFWMLLIQREYKSVIYDVVAHLSSNMTQLRVLTLSLILGYLRRDEHVVLRLR